jgi:signal transduction histidine kinase
MTNLPTHDMLAVLDCIPFSIMLLDSAGDIQYANPTMCRLLDHAAVDLIGNTFAAQPYGRDLTTLVQSDLWEAAGSRRTYTVWATALYNGAAQRTGTLVQITTAVIGWSASDLLNSLLSESLPALTASQSYAELLLRGAAGPLTEQQHQMIHALREQIDRTLTLRHDVLEQAKIHVRNQERLPKAAG